MKSCKLCWALVAVLAIAVAAFAYRFTAGAVKPSEDGRLAVQLTKDERNALLLEMRTWLQSTQAIVAAAAAGDMPAVIRAARASGMAAEAATPGALLAKIPIEMKRLGFATRGLFDEIAAEAEKTRDPQRVLARLGAAMNNCVACHASFRFAEAGT